MSQTKAQLLDGKSATIQFTGGSASAPSVSFTGDTNTGIYSPGADQLAISTNGQGRLFVDANGQVGVNTVSPNAIFTVNGGGAAMRYRTGTAVDGRFEFAYNTTDVGYIGLPDSTTFSVFARTGNALQLGAGGSERLRITSAGLVGVGTSTPSATLHVVGTGLFIGSTQFNNGIELKAATQNYIYFDDALSFTRNGVGPRLTIDSSGRVGVGTTSPSSLLHVAGEVRIGSNASYYARIDHDAAGTGSNIYDHSDNGGHIFRNGGTERLRIDSSGRLLVGTSTNLTEDLIQVQTTNGAALGFFRNSSADGITNGGIRFRSSNGTTAMITGEHQGAHSSGSSPGRLVFSTTADGASSPTERMRIRNNGSTGIFHTASGVGGAVLELNSSATAGTTDYLFWATNSATGTFTGTVCLRAFTNGNVQNTNNSYGAISDAKLKENIVDATSQWSDIKALQVRKYNFKEGQTHTQIGLIAQEIELVSPGLVTESPDRDAEGNDLGTVTKSVNYSVLYMKAVKALQEAMERIEQLETSNADLLARVAALESA